MGHRQCVSRLDAHLEGALPRRLDRRVEHHLRRCPECRAVADQRARVLLAARSIHSRPAATAAVMRPRGVSGRLVVSVLVLTLLVGGLLAALWLVGAPDQGRQAADGPAGAGLEVSPAAAGEVEDAVEHVEWLRAHGWTAPALYAAGLRPLSVDAAREGETARVSVAWGRGEPLVSVRECRGGQDRMRTACAERGAVGLGPERTLPVGVAYRITEGTDRRWTALLTTPEAAYRVDADVPRGQAEALLTQVVVAERSGLAEPPHEDVLGERLERGLERLLGEAGGPTD
ncbi:zf-HC2 domain-containing protein [Micrococcus flavus]|uniref:Putative zinc-finger domain-containing protein n=1 Tax=Micrococcus flavus TaxID=384602 RepID=A0A7W7L294_9MICC|nr:zf-HC2 domain-containing protein [Micrococcus flavus]MBB4882330.1 hypothetical protein [Micrococcus flavus]GGK49539.1 hypothetical protein GCM10007073_15750 [Micrococcus flavus]